MTLSLPSISFVIPVRDDARRLESCLQTIRALDYPRELVEIIVVDNGSKDDSADVARRAGARVLTIAGVRPAQLRNQGAELARGEVLAFVDADHQLARGWLRAAVETLCRRGVGAAGAPYDPPDNPTWVQRMYDTFRVRPAGCQEVEWLGSGNLAVWRRTFHLVGGFDTGIETCEDVDLCRRLRGRGYSSVMSDARMRSVHLGDPATLRALFLGELWRGRDNLRVSLRQPVSIRSLPSVLIPVIDVGSLALALVGLMLVPRGGLVITIAAASVIIGLAWLRALRMLMRCHNARPIDALRAFTVACVYDVARALALVLRVDHRARQIPGGAVSR